MYINLTLTEEPGNKGHHNGTVINFITKGEVTDY